MDPNNPTFSTLSEYNQTVFARTVLERFAPDGDTEIRSLIAWRATPDGFDYFTIDVDADTRLSTASFQIAPSTLVTQAAAQILLMLMDLVDEYRARINKATHVP